MAEKIIAFCSERSSVAAAAPGACEGLRDEAEQEELNLNQQHVFPFTALEGDNPRRCAHGLPIEIQHLSDLLVP